MYNIYEVYIQYIYTTDTRKVYSTPYVLLLFPHRRLKGSKAKTPDVSTSSSRTLLVVDSSSPPPITGAVPPKRAYIAIANPRRMTPITTPNRNTSVSMPNKTCVVVVVQI